MDIRNKYSTLIQYETSTATSQAQNSTAESENKKTPWHGNNMEKQHSILNRLKTKFLQCTVCDYTCTTEPGLIRHMYKHDGKSPYHCQECLNLPKGSDHKCSHAVEKNVKCEQCPFSTKQRFNLSRHVLNIHSVEKPHKCTECDYSCANPYRLKAHSLKHSGQRAHPCQVCSKICHSVGALHVHTHMLSSHSDYRPFKCPHCPYTGIYRSNIDHHTRVHSAEKNHKCGECDFATKEPQTLKAHMYRHSGGRPRPFLCEICPRTYCEKGALTRHQQMVHQGIYPYKCTQCPYACKDRPSLVRHMYKHTGDSPYRCDKCEYVGTSASLLKTHSWLHTGVKPKKCPECEYTCRDKRAYDLRMLTHSGGEALYCADCPYATRDRFSLKLHIAWHSRRKKHPRGGRGGPKIKKYFTSSEEGNPSKESALGPAPEDCQAEANSPVIPID